MSIDHELWLQSLREGDKVAVMSRMCDGIATVSRITKTQIVVGRSRYRKANGRLVGGGTWSFSMLAPVTQTLHDECELRILRKRVGDYANSSDASLPIIRAMWEAKKNAEAKS